MLGLEFRHTEFNWKTQILLQFHETYYSAYKNYRRRIQMINDRPVYIYHWSIKMYTGLSMVGKQNIFIVPIKNDVTLAYHWSIKIYTGPPLVI